MVVESQLPHEIVNLLLVFDWLKQEVDDLVEGVDFLKPFNYYIMRDETALRCPRKGTG